MAPLTNTAPGSAGQNGAHTPGLKQGRIATPLSVRGGPGYGRHDGVVVRDARGYVAAVAINDVPELDAPALARLIAAAPQMLEALRKLAAQCRAEFSVDGKWSNDGQLVTQAAVKSAESAIAAATGEEG